MIVGVICDSRVNRSIIPLKGAEEGTPIGRKANAVEKTREVIKVRVEINT